MPTGDADEQTAVSGEGFKVKPQTNLGGVQLWKDGPYWAECNVGAKKAEDCGYYFWWGDTIGYVRDYGWRSSDDSASWYSFHDSGPTCEKDIDELVSEGYIDAAGNLVPAYDAAAVHLGKSWRIPTEAEFVALVENCIAKTVLTNGVWCFQLNGKGEYASASILLPATGYGVDGDLEDQDSGYYWSSTPVPGYSWQATGFNILQSGIYSAPMLRVGQGSRYEGRPIRPVHE